MLLMMMMHHFGYVLSLISQTTTQFFFASLLLLVVNVNKQWRPIHTIQQYAPLVTIEVCCCSYVREEEDTEFGDIRIFRRSFDRRT